MTSYERLEFLGDAIVDFRKDDFAFTRGSMITSFFQALLGIYSIAMVGFLQEP